jgi:glutathione S-transferase
MTIQLYDLAGADEACRFSPHCWRVRMALAHKGLAVESVAWRFTDKETLAFSGQGLVPVIVDGDAVVADSWQIALYLDETYPDRPALFGSAESRALGRFVHHWCATGLHPAVFRLIVLDLFARLHPKDQAYFRQSREQRLGTTLEAFGADRAAARGAVETALKPLRALLAEQPFLGGATPDYADYIVFGAFMWARAVSAEPLTTDGDPAAAWRDRLLQAFDRLAADAFCAARDRDNGDPA